MSLVAPAPVPAPPPSSAVDMVVSVAGQHFNVHRDVLVQYSGYFRSVLLMEHADGIPTVKDDTRLPVVTVSANLISPRTFAVLLDYMYSSRLRLEADISAADIFHGALMLDMPKVRENRPNRIFFYKKIVCKLSC